MRRLTVVLALVWAACGGDGGGAKLSDGGDFLQDARMADAARTLDAAPTVDAARTLDGGPDAQVGTRIEGQTCDPSASGEQCVAGLLCCYPCGIPGCQNVCQHQPSGVCPALP
jgi:hypothetical protein